MQLEYINMKSPLKRETEDAYVINKVRNIYGVFDGATPLTSFKDEALHNGAYLAANLFRAYFEQLGGTAGEISLVEAVIQANGLLRRKMEFHQVDLGNRHHLWSTCAALVEIKENSIEYAQLGDCMVIAGYKDGKIAVLTKDTVRDISGRAREKRNRDRQIGLDVPGEETFNHPQNSLIYNRSMANTPEGYSVANGMPEVKDYIQYGIIERFNLGYLLIITDGLFYSGRSLEFTFSRVKEIGLQQYAKELLKLEHENGLKIDDKTGIFLKLL